MRKGEGHPDCPPIPGESFSLYLHRLAQHQGYISADAEPPAPFRRRKDRRSHAERLEAIFEKARQPGEEA